ncbi:MAG: chloride channel protein [Acidobacteriaceae bacterium]|jgi:H+/Cl- antiporter ClcA
MEASSRNSDNLYWLTLPAVTVAVGLASGLGGMALGLLLHFIQHVAYGYSLHSLISHESFLEGVSGASPMRRFVTLCVCAAIAGIGWSTLYTFGKPLVSIGKAVKGDLPKMPLLSTVFHVLLQIITVALGSPLGREVAPRELGAVLATRLSDLARLGAENRRIMIACGAGAGLASVYNVPLGGALFTLEVLLGTLGLSALIPALATSVIAAMVAWIGLGNVAQYSVPHLVVSPSLIVWSFVSGPVFGFSAYWFVRAAGAVRARAPRDWRVLPWCAVVFPAIGLLAIQYPQLLGNGKGLAQAGFDGDLGLTRAATLFVLKLLVTLGALRAGAAAGMLTPGLALGGLFGCALGALWNHAWPSVPLGAFAIVGSAAFLASSMKMPLTAIVLILEFTRVGHDFLFPMSLSVAGSIAVFHLCTERNTHTILERPHEDIPIGTERTARSAALVTRSG